MVECLEEVDLLQPPLVLGVLCLAGLCQQHLEVQGGQHPQGNRWGCRHHRRGARRVVHQRQLAEERPVAEGGDLGAPVVLRDLPVGPRPRDEDVDCALADDVEAVALLALPDDVLPLLHLLGEEGVDDVVQGLAVQVAEEDLHLVVLLERLLDPGVCLFAFGVDRLLVVLDLVLGDALGGNARPPGPALVRLDLRILRRHLLFRGLWRGLVVLRGAGRGHGRRHPGGFTRAAGATLPSGARGLCGRRRAGAAAHWGRQSGRSANAPPTAPLGKGGTRGG
mmetsp:Transcript_17917/g.56458  ORF Transcript_17917/g.56458 Transcript_17917/m.56458 type:complete len:279 (-) Transcript_17917:7-843(-)